MEAEQRIWKGSPSQLLNWWIFASNGAYCLIFLAMMTYIGTTDIAWLCLAPLAYAVWKYLDIKCRVYEITTERIIVRSGILSRKTDEMELYRVRDYRLSEPFYLRFFGLCNIELVTDDRTDPILLIPAIKNGTTLLRKIRERVEYLRRNTRNTDIDVRFI
jgi:uncharacterized membrane protein YdbT with pleckstrin-like domain